MSREGRLPVIVKSAQGAPWKTISSNYWELMRGLEVAEGNQAKFES